MLYLSHAYDGASENENEEAKDHHKVLRRNNCNFQSSRNKGPPQRTVEKVGHFHCQNFHLEMVSLTSQGPPQSTSEKQHFAKNQHQTWSSHQIA